MACTGLGTLACARSLWASDIPAALVDCHNLLAAWQALGWHWTGSDVERRTTDWLARTTSLWGLAVELEAYPLVRIDVAQCTVQTPAGRAPPDYRCSMLQERLLAA